jgi:hypothetical protein
MDTLIGTLVAVLTIRLTALLVRTRPEKEALEGDVGRWVWRKHQKKLGRTLIEKLQAFPGG